MKSDLQEPHEVIENGFASFSLPLTSNILRKVVSVLYTMLLGKNPVIINIIAECLTRCVSMLLQHTIVEKSSVGNFHMKKLC